MVTAVQGTDSKNLTAAQGTKTPDRRAVGNPPLAFADEEKDMDIEMKPQTLRGFVVVSLIFGVLGGGFYWWVPMGMVLSMAGLLFGLVDWTMARRRSLNARLSIAAIILSLATLALDIVIALNGLQTWTFGDFR